MAPLILIADDDGFIRDVLREMLSSYEVIEAENGAKAVQMFRSHSPNMVIMDILMPEMDGIQATREIKQIDCSAVVLGISASSAVKGEEMVKAGAQGVMSKPVRISALLEKVQSYLE